MFQLVTSAETLSENNPDMLVSIMLHHEQRFNHSSGFHRAFRKKRVPCRGWGRGSGENDFMYVYG